LTDAERERFALWLEFEAKNGDDMAAIMEKNGMPAVLIKKERAEAMAAKVIAKKLRSIESFTVER
jgi:hypothetical protein